MLAFLLTLNLLLVVDGKMYTRLKTWTNSLKHIIETGQLVMMLQEEIVFTEYFRCYCLDRQDVHIMQYDPRQPHEFRYVRNPKPLEKKLLDDVHNGVLALNKALRI
jgi:hypothetical protein